MATLVILRGPNAGRSFTLHPERSLIGRRPDSAVFLESLAVSREHACITCQDGIYHVEDLGSSNGTFVNERRVPSPTPLCDADTLRVGPYEMGLRTGQPTATHDSSLVIRTQITALPNNSSLYGQNPAGKLQVVLEIAQHLARSLDTQTLLDKLLDQLMRLFPQSDRGMVMLLDGGNLVVKAQKVRTATSGDFSYSRTLVKKALDDGVGILSEDVNADKRFAGTETLLNLNLRSLLCVPLIGTDARRLGVLQLDSLRAGFPFRGSDLEMLTTIGLMVAVVLENVAMHDELLRQERLRQELVMAREIQESFLPTNFEPLGKSNFELFANIHPAREVSGDLYDFFPLDDGRLAFCVGDVAGKGMAAAMFMVRVQTLHRHIATSQQTPAQTLGKLNAALEGSADSGLFVTMAHGVYNPKTSEVQLASAGHPLPLLRRADGKVEELKFPTGFMLGAFPSNPRLTDAKCTLGVGDTLILFTDGFVEAKQGKEMFDPDRLQKLLGPALANRPLASAAETARLAVEKFTGQSEQQDDLTLLMLRRV